MPKTRGVEERVPVAQVVSTHLSNEASNRYVERTTARPETSGYDFHAERRGTISVKLDRRLD